MRLGDAVLALWRARRRRRMPPVFANSVPKAGTHLMFQILGGIPGMSRSRTPFLFEGSPAQQPEQFRLLAQVPRQQYAAGHIYYSAEYADTLRRLGMRCVFISRDPRDIVVSLAHFYVDRQPGHPAHRYLRELPSQQARYRALIRGVRTEGYAEPPFGVWIESFLGWLHDDNTIAVTFEELVRAPSSRDQALLRIARALLGERDRRPLTPVVAAMAASIDPARSETYRRGRIGDWRQEFDEETRELFEATAGHVLVRLGYERERARWVTRPGDRAPGALGRHGAA